MGNGNGAKGAKDSEEREKQCGKHIKQSVLYENMDSLNKKVVDAIANGGMKPASKVMFTDEETGSEISYAEMRMRYG